MKRRLFSITFAAVLLFGCQANAQQAGPIFPKGDLSTVKNHTGEIWLNELNVGDSTFDPSIAQATYGPGAKLDWHITQAVRCCSSPKAPDITKNGAGPFGSYTRVT